MTRARRERISPSDTPCYHCIARCVRRAFLCGEDQFSEKYWTPTKIRRLTSHQDSS